MFPTKYEFSPYFSLRFFFLLLFLLCLQVFSDFDAGSLVAISLFPIFAVTVHGTNIIIRMRIRHLHIIFDALRIEMILRQMYTYFTNTNTCLIYEPYESPNHNNITFLCVRGFTLRLQSLTFDWVEKLSTVNCFACITSHQISFSLSICTRFSCFFSSSFKWKTYPS